MPPVSSFIANDETGQLNVEIREGNDETERLNGETGNQPVSGTPREADKKKQAGKWFPVCY